MTPNDLDPSRPDDPSGHSILGHRASRRAVLLGMAYSAVSAVLVACGVQSNSNAPSGSTGSAAPSTGGSPSSAPSLGAGPIIRVGSADGGQDLWNTWNINAQPYVWNWTHQRLVSLDPVTNAMIYEAAASYEVSPDGLVYTWKLVPDLLFHDGTPLTARDVVFTYNTCLKASAGSNVSGYMTSLKGYQTVIDDESKDAEGLEAVDDLTVKVTLANPDGSFMSRVFGQLFITPAHYFDGLTLEQYAEAEVNTKLGIGSGPYRMVERVENESVTLEAYDDFKCGDGYSGPPASVGVTLRNYADKNAQLLSVTAGEVDFSYLRGPSRDGLAALEALPDMRAQASPTGLNYFMAVNLLAPTTPLLKDVRVRQALTWALDREFLVSDVLGGGVGMPTYMNDWQAAWANADGLETYTPQNTDKAKQLLADAGWDPSANLNIRHYPPTLNPDVPLIIQTWEELGVKGTLTPFTDDNFSADLYEDKDKTQPGDQGPNFDIGLGEGLGWTDGQPWGSDTVVGTGKVYPDGYNATRYSNPEWDAAYAAAASAPTPEETAEHFKRASEIFAAELPYVPMYLRIDYAMVAKTLIGPEQSTLLHPSNGGTRWWLWRMEG